MVCDKPFPNRIFIRNIKNHSSFEIHNTLPHGSVFYVKGIVLMNILQEAALEFSKLFNKDYIYMLENGIEIKLFFAPHHFHHLAGLQKLTDIPSVNANPKNNSAAYIFKKIADGTISYEEISKSKRYGEIESRIRHFKQINIMVNSSDVIFNFDPSLVHTDKLQEGYLIFKMSNDNLFLNLLIKKDSRKTEMHIPYTYIPRMIDDYTYRQDKFKIISITEIERKKS